MTSASVPSRRFVRFLGAGALNTSFGYGVFLVAMTAGAAAPVALALQFIIGILWNYMLHARLVFGARGFGRLPAYAGCYALLYAVNAMALDALARPLGPATAQAVLTLPVATLSYLMIARVMR